MPDRAPRRQTARDPLTDPAALDVGGAGETPRAVQPDLASGERVLAELRGIGASMFVTTERIMVARDGRERRPRSGLQSFPLGTVTGVRLEPGERPSGRIAVVIGTQEVVSIFFDARSSDRALEFLEIVRPAIARHRREQEALARHRSSG